jgi:hypothetical protein
MLRGRPSCSSHYPAASMDDQSTREPLKVCPRCAVASRTDSDRCPNCGREYRRRLWRWWFAIPIVALAFAGGYFGLAELVYDDDEPLGLTAEEAQSLPDAGPPSDLEAVVDGVKPVDTRDQSEGGIDLQCRYYAIVDSEDTVWEACYLGGRLEVSRAFELK